MLEYCAFHIYINICSVFNTYVCCCTDYCYFCECDFDWLFYVEIEIKNFRTVLWVWCSIYILCTTTQDQERQCLWNSKWISVRYERKIMTTFGFKDTGVENIYLGQVVNNGDEAYACFVYRICISVRFFCQKVRALAGLLRVARRHLMDWAMAATSGATKGVNLQETFETLGW